MSTSLTKNPRRVPAAEETARRHAGKPFSRLGSGLTSSTCFSCPGANQPKVQRPLPTDTILLSNTAHKQIPARLNTYPSLRTRPSFVSNSPSCRQDRTLSSSFEVARSLAFFHSGPREPRAKLDNTAPRFLLSAAVASWFRKSSAFFAATDLEFNAIPNNQTGNRKNKTGNLWRFVSLEVCRRVKGNQRGGFSNIDGVTGDSRLQARARGQSLMNTKYPFPRWDFTIPSPPIRKKARSKGKQQEKI